MSSNKMQEDDIRDNREKSAVDMTTTGSDLDTSDLIRFTFSLMPEWPKLGWLAKLTPGSDVIEVLHGSGVEVGPGWFIEGIWDGAFSEGNFDQTDVVFGSGGRLRDQQLTFVSSGSLKDRIQYLSVDNKIYISNSLACLIANSKAKLDPAFSRYRDIIITISNGLGSYIKQLPTNIGPVNLVYFFNLHWDGRQLREVNKPGGENNLQDFTTYASYLHTSLAALVDNLSSQKRKNSLGKVGTLSRGYDSAAVSALTGPLGVNEVITFSKARGGFNDDGGKIAHILGLDPIRLDRNAWRNQLSLEEVPFFAGDGLGQDLHFNTAGAFLRNRVLFSGYPGEFWRMEPPSLENDLVTTDCAGLSLTEYRLQIGMIHCPVGYLGARQVRDINRINRSLEMRPWDVGGEYSKPICRRIVEEAGVPREFFGNKKMATAILDIKGAKFLNPSSMIDFENWLSENRSIWLKRGKLPPSVMLDKLFGLSRELVQKSAIHVSSWLSRMPGVWRITNNKTMWRLKNINEWIPPVYLRRYLFAWSIDRMSRMYTDTKK